MSRSDPHLIPSDHLLKADRNKRFVTNYVMNFIEEYPDWVSIVTFYSALHYVEALLAAHGLHREHHEERNRDVSSLMPEIESEYLNLYDLGKTSRYYSMSDMPTAVQVKDAVSIDLPKIEEFVRSQLVYAIRDL